MADDPVADDNVIPAGVDKGAPPPPKTALPPKLPPADQGFPVGLTYTGLAVGVGLLAAGLGTMVYSIQLYGIGVLSLCIGLAITLAVFGNRAEGTIFRFNVAGAGAMAIVLYLLLLFYPIIPFEIYAKGKIQQTEGLAGVLGTARNEFFVGRPQKTGNYEFVIFEKDLGPGQLYFHFQFPQESTVKELYIGCINSSVVKAAMEKRSELSFTLEQGQAGGEYQLIDNDTSAPIGKLNRKRCNEGDTDRIPTSEIGWLNMLIPSAHAQQPKAFDLQSVTRSLEAEDPGQRDFGRSQIGSIAAENEFAALAADWNVATSSYRNDLGHLVGYSTAIDQDRQRAVYIANSLSTEQLRYLVQLTGQGDFTLRQFATEVLHRLLETTGWPSGPEPDKSKAIIDAVIEGVRTTDFQVVKKPEVDFSSENRLYNTLVSVGFTECNIAPQYRPGLISAVQQLTAELSSLPDKAKTRAKSEQVARRLSSC